MDRPLRKFRKRALSTNLQFLKTVIAHPLFLSGECATGFVDITPELFNFGKRRDRVTRLLKFLDEIAVNGNPEMKGRALPALPIAAPIKPICDITSPIPKGSRVRFKELGALGFAQLMRDQQQVLLTDTTMRDAHQSLVSTRLCSHDMTRIAPNYARMIE